MELRENEGEYPYYPGIAQELNSTSRSTTTHAPHQPFGLALPAPIGQTLSFHLEARRTATALRAHDGLVLVIRQGPLALVDPSRPSLVRSARGRPWRRAFRAWRCRPATRRAARATPSWDTKRRRRRQPDVRVPAALAGQLGRCVPCARRRYSNLGSAAAAVGLALAPSPSHAVIDAPHASVARVPAGTRPVALIAGQRGRHAAVVCPRACECRAWIRGWPRPWLGDGTGWPALPARYGAFLRRLPDVQQRGGRPSYAGAGPAAWPDAAAGQGQGQGQRQGQGARVEPVVVLCRERHEPRRGAPTEGQRAASTGDGDRDQAAVE